METTQIINQQLLPDSVCPVSGLPVVRKPEWTNAGEGKDYCHRLSIIGDRILWVQISGYITMAAIDSFTSLAGRVMDGRFVGKHPYVQIADWSGLQGSSVESKKSYIDSVKDNEQLIGLVLYGVSASLKIGVKMVKRLDFLKIKVKVANDYAEAVKAALELLTGAGYPVGEKLITASSEVFPITSQAGNTQYKRLTRPDWVLQTDNFSLRFEIINGYVLHGISIGRLEPEHIAPAMELQEKVIQSMDGTGSSYYYILNLMGSEGTGQKTRKLYVDAVVKLNKRYPLQMFVFYGLNKLLRAGIFLAQPFVPFKVRVADNLEMALAAIAADFEAGSLKAGSKTSDVVKRSSAADQVQPYVEELLQFIEKINWATGGIETDSRRDPDHPFGPVFEAIELIKWELDDLLRERKQAEADRIKLETQLQQARKMETIGTLAGGVAHDLNNILSGIVSYPELLLMNMPPDSPYHKPLLTIQKSGEKAAAIVQDLLTLARRGVFVSEVVDLNEIVSENLQTPELDKIVQYHPKVRITVNLDDNLLNIKGSPVHLSKTIFNLISNAAEAMPDGGEITISTANQYVDCPVQGHDEIKQGDYAVLKIADTGIGIAAEDQEKIFEPFFTKKKMGRSGTGLGMAVVWGTVKDHKGYIDIDSRKGQGTTFSLYFPVTRQLRPSEGARPTAAFEDLKGDGEMILVVDDVDEQREIASAILTQLGYRVETVSGGEAAVGYLKSNHADLVVLDMIMPPGIDGLETYQRIIALKPGQKTVIASGYTETDRVKKMQKLGAGAYVKKPYTLEKIGQAVKSELGKPEQN